MAIDPELAAGERQDMADFRIPLPDGPDAESRRELDWDHELSRWTLSEQEYGSSRWDLGMTPTPWDLREILRFFRLTTPIAEPVLVGMTPGECVMRHREDSDVVSVVADLCPACNVHWLVYRLDDDIWRLYGRSCGFAWHRGRPSDPESDPVLAQLLGLATS